MFACAMALSQTSLAVAQVELASVQEHVAANEGVMRSEPRLDVSQ